MTWWRWLVLALVPAAAREDRFWLRCALVAFGLFWFAFGLVLALLSGLGLNPWSVLSDGLTRIAPLSFGLTTSLIGLMVIGLAWVLGIRPALGTIMNMALVGIYVDLLLFSGLVPDLRTLGWSPTDWAARVGMNLLGVIIVGLSTGLYIKGGLGPGPRDGLMLGLSQRLRRPVGLVRTGIEVLVLLVGILLGGTAGLGTLLFALGIGPVVQLSFRWFGIPSPQARH